MDEDEPSQFPVSDYGIEVDFSKQSLDRMKEVRAPR